MENKIYIMNEKRYKQIEIECSRMAQEKTVFFLVPEAEETRYILYLEDCLYACDFTIAEIIEDAKENNMDYFICALCMTIEWKVKYKQIKGIFHG